MQSNRLYNFLFSLITSPTSLICSTLSTEFLHFQQNSYPASKYVNSTLHFPASSFFFTQVSMIDTELMCNTKTRIFAIFLRKLLPWRVHIQECEWPTTHASQPLGRTSTIIISPICLDVTNSGYTAESVAKREASAFDSFPFEATIRDRLSRCTLIIDTFPLFKWRRINRFIAKQDRALIRWSEPWRQAICSTCF